MFVGLGVDWLEDSVVDGMFVLVGSVCRNVWQHQLFNEAERWTMPSASWTAEGFASRETS